VQGCVVAVRRSSGISHSQNRLWSLDPNVTPARWRVVDTIV
jgi:hypothetical protein